MCTVLEILFEIFQKHHSLKVVFSRVNIKKKLYLRHCVVINQSSYITVVQALSSAGQTVQYGGALTFDPEPPTALEPGPIAQNSQ